MGSNRLLARLALALAMAVWWGGLTFYSLVVVPTGAKVLGGEIEQGFVTREVSKTINLLGAGTMVVLAWHWLVTCRTTRTLLRRGMVVCWLTMLVSQAVLFYLYPQLDAHLAPATREIAEPSRFHATHEFYISIVGVQWGAGLLYWIATLLPEQVMPAAE